MAKCDDWQRQILTELKQTQVLMADNLRQMNDTHRVMCEDVRELKIGVINLQQVLLRIVLILVGIVGVIAAGEKIVGMF